MTDRQPDFEFRRHTRLWFLLPHEQEPDGARLMYRVYIQEVPDDDTDQTYHATVEQSLFELFGNRGPVVVTDRGPDLYTVDCPGAAGTERSPCGDA